METFEKVQLCEVCSKLIPDDYKNLLCASCYLASEERATKEREEKKARIAEEQRKVPNSPVNEEVIHKVTPIGEDTETVAIPTVAQAGGNRFGILDPNYQENPEADDKNQILANLAQFIYSHNPEKGRKGVLLWYPQRNMYTFIKNYCMKKILSHPQYPKYIWKPDIVDVGCGSGTGANIMSQEANFVWGIDKNDWSIEFAKEAFTREKNGIYYSNQLTFDQVDIMTDTRDFMKFDIVVAVEVIEHVYDTQAFLTNIIKKFTKRDKKGIPMDEWNKTEFFISSPNRNFKKIRKDKPENPYHVREWTSQELFDYLGTFFKNVEIMNQKGEPVARETEADEVVFFKCSIPKI